MTDAAQPAPRRQRTADRVDLLCDEFERRFRAGDMPRIEEYVAAAGEHDGTPLLRELIVVECALRIERGERPLRDEYRSRFSGQTTVVDAAFVETEKTLTAVQAQSGAGGGSEQDAWVARGLPCEVGDFELLGVLGTGGMGVVYKARQKSLQRVVALKTTLPTMMTSTVTQRFQREAELAARMAHPHIVPVFGVGTIEGRHYLAMEWIDGCSLADRIRSGPMDPDDAARLLIIICDAVAFAHERMVIHRDLKPENVLLDCDGIPHVADFGLATPLEVESALTNPGQALGTPAYMPPEQVRNDRTAITVRIDIYALGGILYGMLTGHPPFVGTNPFDVMNLSVHAEPDPPRKHRRGVPLNLEAICLKCLQKKPEHRYESVRSLAADLQRFLDRRPTEARPVGIGERALLWCIRNRGTAILLTTASLLATSLLVYFQTRPAYLDVTITPRDARVLVGEQAVPIQQGVVLAPVPPGRSVIRIEADGFEPQEFQVDMNRGRDNAFRGAFELTPTFGFLHLDSVPSAAAIELLDPDGAVIAHGTTPFYSARLPQGEYLVRLRKDLYRPAAQTVSIPKGERTEKPKPVRLEPAVEGTGTYARLVKLRAALQRPISKPWGFRDTPLRSVFAEISKTEGIAVHIDAVSLKEEGIATESPLTLSVQSVSLQQGLNELCRNLMFGYVPDLEPDGKLLLKVTSFDRMESTFKDVTFPIGDLLGSGGPDGQPSDIGTLAREIASNTSCRWSTGKRIGGTMRFQEDAGALIVKQTVFGQLDVLRYLTDRREARVTKSLLDAK